jgi:tartrate-resistant acid phosphatase type 5
VKRSLSFWFTLIWLLAALIFLPACGVANPPGPGASPTVLLQHNTPLVDTTLPPVVLPAATATENVPTQTPTPTFTPEASPTPTPLRFAVIGDFGEGNQAEQDVADLVKSWNPDLIITVGDNNYPSGAAETIDDRIGRFYSEFIYPYTGSFGPGGEQNRFFPTLGNHDWDTARAQAYFDYFTLPGNERYYDFVQGPVHFFAVSADSREPDGVARSSAQAQWLQERLAASTSPWKIVYFHQPPYSSGYHGPVDWMVWPFEEWGASAVLSGHDHDYERLQVGGIPYFVNGLGGGPIYYFILTEPESQVRFNDDYGAMLVSADEAQIIFQFITRRGEVIDEHILSR